jgi:transcriptional regulator with XRE-family HTH domain
MDIKWLSMSDKALEQRVGRYIKHHRMEQNKTQDMVAASASISRSTLSLLENGETVTLATLIQVLRVLDLLQVMEAFSIDERVSPLLIAKAEKNKRKRTTRKGSKNQQEVDW